MPNRSQQRRANFFKGTSADLDAGRELDAAEVQALAVVRTNIESQALSLGHRLSTTQIDNALSVAQRLIRTLPRDQLQGISANSGLLKSIIDQSLASAPNTDPRLASSAIQHSIGTGGANVDPSRIGFRAGSESAGRSGYGELSSSGVGQLSETDARRLKEIMPIAMMHGLQWMPPRDLLAIGRDGIKAIADVNLKQPTYERLRTDALFAPKDVVEFARYAKGAGIKDANAAGQAIADVVKSGGTPVERQELSQAYKDYFQAQNALRAAPNDPAAREKAEQATKRYQERMRAQIAKKPESEADIRRAEEALRMRQEHRATAQQREATAQHGALVADQQERKADTAIAQATSAKADALDGFDDPPKSGTTTDRVEGTQPSPNITRTADADHPPAGQSEPGAKQVAAQAGPRTAPAGTAAPANAAPTQTAALADDKKPAAKAAPAAPKMA